MNYFDGAEPKIGCSLYLEIMNSSSRVTTMIGALSMS